MANESSISTVRFYTFPDLATANASLRKFRHNTFIRVKGDTSRFKQGDGDNYGQGSTFSQLSWVNRAKSTVATAVNTTATLTTAAIRAGFITSTSAAAVTMTLPTATTLGTAVGASRGTEISFTVDNTAGANTVTVAVGTGITAATPVITGGATLTIAAGTVGRFLVYFTSASAALLFRTF